MNNIFFSATLICEEDGICEPGQACIEPFEDSVTFSCDFVPLIRLGSRATIVRTLGEMEFERFEGRVYLSSRKLLRIVEVDHEVVSSVRPLFDSNCIFPVTLFMANKRHKMQKAEMISGFLRYISPTEIKICTMEFADAGQELIFSLSEPGLYLEKLSVTIIERILLMRSAAVLLCRINPPSEANAAAIDDYLRALQFRQAAENAW